MNKLFLFALLALVAACAAAPSESAPLDPTAAATDLPAHEQDKRAIFYRTPGFGAYRTGYYPGYGYDYPSASYYPAGYNYPYYGSLGSSYLI